MIKINRATLILFWNIVLLIEVHYRDVWNGAWKVDCCISPSIPTLTSTSSASVDRVTNSLISSVSITQCTLQENHNIIENTLQMLDRNISSSEETLNRLIEAQRTSREQVRNEGRYSARWPPIREKYKRSHQSRATRRQQ